jgi:hypothetical protein
MKNSANPTAPNKPLHNIYKLEQLRKSTNETSLESLRKRSKAKYAQNNLMRIMKKLDTPYKEKYEDTINCSSLLQQQGNEITSRYCFAFQSFLQPQIFNTKFSIYRITIEDIVW